MKCSIQKKFQGPDLNCGVANYNTNWCYIKRNKNNGTHMNEKLETTPTDVFIGNIKHRCAY